MILIALPVEFLSDVLFPSAVDIVRGGEVTVDDESSNK